MADFLAYMKAKKRVKLSKRQTLMHYFFVPVIALLACNIYTLYWPSNLVLIIGFGLAILYAIRQYLSLKFRLVPIKIDDEEFKRRVAEIAPGNEWILEFKAKDWLIYSTLFRWTNWGTVIYIVRDNDHVMICSICDLYRRPSTISFGVNKRNIDSFVNYFNGLSKA